MGTCVLQLAAAILLLTAVSSGYHLPEDNGYVDSSEPSSKIELSGPELASRMTVGTLVVRGKDWEWDDQDGGSGNVGTVIRKNIDGWVRVEWNSGEINSYRMGSHNKYDLYLFDDSKKPSLATEAETVHSEETTEYSAGTPEYIEFTTEYGTTTEGASVTESELISRFTIGTRVIRGKSWSWGDQDGGVGNKGTIVGEIINGWVRVKWDSGETNTYRMGDEGKYDLDLADCIVVTTNSTPESERLSGPELAARMTVGTKVVRGKDWDWNNQDGGAGGKGTIVRGPLDGWVRVQWDLGDINSYRMGYNDKYDLDLLDSYSISTTIMTVTDDTSAKSSFSGPELALHMTIGTRVVRGKDWIWDDQDGGAGNQGTVIEGDVDGWVQVEWDSGDVHSYRMGDEDKYDLDLADSSSLTTTTTEENTPEATTTEGNAPEATTIFGPKLAALMQVGTRVVRGKDWKWDDQDGGPGGKGTVTLIGVYEDWVSVRWDNGNSYNYRMGDRGKYDLSLADGSEKTTSPEPEISTVTDATEIATDIKVGSRVIRGRDWDWGDQDGGPGGKGTVTSIGVYDDWVSVRWDNGNSYNYRMGDRGKYDLSLADGSETTETTSPEPEISTVTDATEITTDIKVGSRVIRGRDWDWGEQDGGPGGKGTVTSIGIYEGWVSVSWDNGNSYNYRMGDRGKYDLSLADGYESTSSEGTTTATPSTTESSISTTTEETTLTSPADNVQESNKLFGLLVEKEISNVPRKDRIQTMQDVLEVLKKFSKWH